MVINNQQVFLELVRSGLWEKESQLLQYGDIDYAEVVRLAEEQSVVGLVTAGLEHVKDVKVPQDELLQFIGQCIQIEQRNKSMNSFISKLVDKLREQDIYCLLVKGQGIAQCYERPQWRTSGDIDLLLSEDNYRKAKELLKQLSTDQKPECNYSKELGLFFDSWSVELHGSLRTGLSSKVDLEIDSVQKDVFCGGYVRSWQNENAHIFLPAANEDVFFVFTHFIKHFYKEGGVSLRQMCDWCRLLWTYKDSLNHELLKSRFNKAGLMSEWKAFAALAVDLLGMPIEAMPLYDASKRWSKKSEQIMEFVLKGGEWRKVHDTIAVGKIFPKSVLRFAPGILLNLNWQKIKEMLFGQVRL